MRYFKIIKGYKSHEFTRIDESELEAAICIFLTDGKALFKNGVVRGKDIMDIREDWHKEMGWNDDHELRGDDWNELNTKGVTLKYVGVIAAAKDNVKLKLESQKTPILRMLD